MAKAAAKGAAKGKKSGEKKKKAKREGPPAPPGPYFIFMKELRPKIAAANPNLKVTEIAQKIGAEWKKLSDAQKAQYKAKAEALKKARG